MSSRAVSHIASAAAQRSKPALLRSMSAPSSSITSITGARLCILRLYPRRQPTLNLSAGGARAVPLLVHDRRDLARLDLAAAAPEDVRVAYRDAARAQVLVDRALVGQHQLAFRAV